MSDNVVLNEFQLKLVKGMINKLIKEFIEDFKMINMILEKTKAINLYPYIEKWEGRLKE